MDHRRPKCEMRGNINETCANVTLGFERYCVTKMRSTRVCMRVSMGLTVNRQMAKK